MVERPDIILARHGYSEGNAGKRTTLGEIALTQEGYVQSEVLADNIAQRYGAQEVSHIIVTPYIRTQQTAAPLVALTGLEPLIWPDLREITYLQPSSADGKTYDERAVLRDAFWGAARLDPDYVDEGEYPVESVSSFLHRIRASLGALAALAASGSGLTVVYAHEFPISAAVNIARGKSDKEIIADMVAEQKPLPRIENTQAVGLTLADGALVVAKDVDIDLFSINTK